jgi:SAM-dependent methyltransferase
MEQHTQTVIKNKRVLDVCCGGRMFWFNKYNPDALYIDKRTMAPKKMSNGATFGVAPDIVMDFRDLKFTDKTFSLIVFDPPHVARAGKTSFVADKYGYLEKDTWREDLRKGFEECFRVLSSDGVLVFKWNECHIPLKEILGLTPVQPLFGQRGGRSYKTHFIVFIKPRTVH